MSSRADGRRSEGHGMDEQTLRERTQRELCAVAALTALHRPNEVRAHIHAALNVGATRQEVAEAIFQQVTYGGMPVVVDALEVYANVLAERGEPFPADEEST